MKEEICYVSQNFASDMAKVKMEKGIFEKKYEMPDGSVVNVNQARFMAPESLFQPDLVRENDDSYGIHKMIYATIEQLDIGVRQEMFNSIILNGGSSQFRGLPQRLRSEIG